MRGLGTTATVLVVPSVFNRYLGLRPEPPASASGDCFITSGLRPEPPASASGDPFAPRRACRAAPCAAWGRLLQCSSSPLYSTDIWGCAPNPQQALAGTASSPRGCAPNPRQALAGPLRPAPPLPSRAVRGLGPPQTCVGGPFTTWGLRREPPATARLKKNGHHPARDDGPWNARLSDRVHHPLAAGVITPTVPTTTATGRTLRSIMEPTAF